jgi:peptidoglycan/LPS O-acetylase OafA/YrhL
MAFTDHSPLLTSAQTETQIEARLPSDGLTRHRRPLLALTGVRFFAAFWIVFFHTRVAATLIETGRTHLGNFFRHGNLAVSLFFLLSGFILAYTHRGQIEDAAGVRRFYEARFARIWPAYALSLVVCSLAYWFLPPIGPALATLFMVQAWKPLDTSLPGAWNIVCWSLSVEAFFYLVFPFFQRWIERRSRLFCSVSIFVFLFLGVLGNTAAHTLGEPGYEGLFRYLTFPIVRLPEFFLGVCLGNLFLLSNRNVPFRIPRIPAAWTWTGFLSALILLSVDIPRWSSLVLVSFSIVLLGLAAETSLLSRFLSTRVIVFGGAVSYSVYLLQMPAKVWGHNILAAIGINSATAQMAAVPVVLLALAIPAYLFVEEPSRKALRKTFAALSPQKAPTQAYIDRPLYAESEATTITR